MQCQTARSREGLRSLVEEAALHQCVGDELLQILRGTPLHAGRNLFGAQFEEKIRHGERASEMLFRDVVGAKGAPDDHHAKVRE